MLRHLIIVLALSGCVFSKKIKHEALFTDVTWQVFTHHTPFQCNESSPLDCNVSRSRCRHDGVRGTCVKYYECDSAADHLNNGTLPTICLIKDDIPIVCCTDCLFVKDTRKKVFNKDLGTLNFDGPTALDKCVHYVDKLKYPCKGQFTAEVLREFHPIEKCFLIGESLSGFITQSPTLPPRKETYMAILGYGGEIKDAKWSCAGAIISGKYIITAAHCVSDPSLGPVKYIGVNIEGRTDPGELWEIYDVKRTIPHPDYKPPSKYHDIGLIETKDIITFSEAVLPACLHTDKTPQDIAETIVWDPTGRDQGRLKPASLTQFDETQCSLFYPTRDILPNGFDNETQFCFGTIGKPEDSCLSDSGSPLVANYQAQLCAPLIIGVTSFDRSCGTAASSGLYTRVKHYIPWIESIVWP